ncbi:Ran GTPase-activating protein (RanGAP) involved in mRNA processing and transport [Legionella beliardensis]|uniref:Ran GTPase-activating protein (RanGAP) involved in mRNA processing and transport n=1 Tax=Legionella beliardensis TaxID=91822 RepID=A0A378I2I1_9GAMM|nr:hypothetical protein [Legionella beliardensis]STX28866.1 Ran GTPase-activating protein (RanGAP) involved in mRNA processing and transport [Legionella beliardensis]
MQSKIETLPEVIKRLANDDNLTSLSLTHIAVNPIPDPHYAGHFIYQYYDADLLLLAQALETNTTLKEFKVIDRGSSCKLQWTEAGAQAIGQALKNIPTLETVTINLQNLSLSGPEVMGFLECLNGNAQIKHLDFYFYCDDLASMNHLGALLMNNKSLESIYLQGKISSLNLAPLTFVDGLMESKSLRALTINYIQLGDDGVKKLATFLNQHPLKELTLNQCGFTGKATKDLLPALTHHCAIEVLNLSSNNLGDDGIQYLVNELPLLKNLTVLYLNSIGISSNGLDSLVTGLRTSNCSIKKLILDSNSVWVEDMNAIKKLIRNNLTLNSLSMNFCNLADGHVSELIPLFSDPNQCSLYGFTFVDNFDLESKTQQKILDAIRKNPNLLSFNPPGGTNPLLSDATKINRRKKTQQSQAAFVNACIVFAQIYYRVNPDNLSVFSASTFFPLELTLRIIMEASKGTLGMNEKAMKECATLIFENLALRRSLITSPGTYSSSDWWRKSTTVQGAPKTLFTAVKEIEHSKENIENPCTIM